MSSSTLNNSSSSSSTKVNLDEYSSYKWYHSQNIDSASSSNNRKKSIAYLKNGDFYVDKLSNDLQSLNNSSLPDLNRINGFSYLFFYLSLFSIQFLKVHIIKNK